MVKGNKIGLHISGEVVSINFEYINTTTVLNEYLGVIHFGCVNILFFLQALPTDISIYQWRLPVAITTVLL